MSEIKDRHENRNWTFVKAKPDPNLPGRFIRLYRSTTNPDLYKRVGQRIGGHSFTAWQGVQYGLSTARNADGQLAWCRSVEEALYAPQRLADHARIVEYNTASDARRREMDADGTSPFSK